MKIVVGMSGGVDSAVVAKILKDQGHEVIGIFMRNWDAATNNDLLGNPNKDAEICPEERDWEDVQTLGKQIGIEVQRVDFIQEYWDEVFRDLIHQYKNGRTPNPDILCNRHIKFGSFFDWVFANIPNVDKIATGHYASIIDGQLYKPADKWKDQTYFLAQVKKERFSKVIFPLANIAKEKVRDIALKNFLIVASKKDSTGICFIGERDFSKFLQNYIPAQPGDILDITNNKVIGKHVGAMYYTIGQRKGLHLGGMNEPYYVAGHDLKKRIIYVAPSSDMSYLMSTSAIVSNVNWIANLRDITKVEVKFRYKSKSVVGQIEWINDSSLKITYPEGFEAVTPGQQAGFYKNNLVLGGGIIDKVVLKNNKILK